MSAARQLPREARPALALADPRNDPRYLRTLLGDARAQLSRARQELAFLGFAVATLSRRAAPAQPCDIEAERRLLGGLLHHREEVSDATAAELLFEAIEPLDLLGPGHARILCACLSCLNTKLQPTRSRVRGILDGRPGADEALDALALLPWPAEAPLRELYTVGALARWRRTFTPDNTGA